MIENTIQETSVVSISKTSSLSDYRVAVPAEELYPGGKIVCKIISKTYLQESLPPRSNLSKDRKNPDPPLHSPEQSKSARHHPHHCPTVQAHVFNPTRPQDRIRTYLTHHPSPFPQTLDPRL